MIGTYYRLSFADEDVGTDKAESNSIQGQRGLVEGYIMARPELAAEPRQEYVDDGYSGTSTSRPAFQQLIQDAQDGKIKTIIVKDFSRFARDYIEAGDYMERIFPLLGVRFISVNDEYDSGMQARGTLSGAAGCIRIRLRRCFGTRWYVSSAGGMIQHFLCFQLSGRRFFFPFRCFVGLIFF